MTFRPHRTSSKSTGIAALDYEIVQEQASALGRLGRALEQALAALQEQQDGDARSQLLDDAGHALWCFVVQREACGLRDPRPVFRDYRVPVEVQNRMGVCGGGPAQR